MPARIIAALGAASLALGCAPAKEPRESAALAPEHATATATAPAPTAAAPSTPSAAGVDGAIALNRPLLVFVHAEWCRSCRRAEPAVAWLRSEYAGRVSFVDLDLTDEQAAAQSALTAERLGLGAFFAANEGRMGVTILGRGGRLVRRLAGETRPAPYRSAIEEALATFGREAR